MSEIKGLAEIDNLTEEQIDSALQKDDMNGVDLAAVQNEINDSVKYGDNAAKTAVLSGLSAATFGLSDQVLVKSGAMKAEDLRKLKEQNPDSALLGEVTGVVGPAILSGGTSLAAKTASAGVKAASKAGAATEKVVSKMLNKAIKESGSQSIAKEIVKKTVEKGAGSAVEGAFYGAGKLVSEDALGEADFNADNLLAYAGGGALLGGALGSTIGAISPVITTAGQKVKGAASKIGAKYGDVQKDAQKLFGIADKEVLKNPKLMDDVVDYARNRLSLKIGDDLDSLISKNKTIKDAAVKELDDIYDTVGPRTVNRSVFARTADALESEFVKGKEGLASFKGLIAPVKNNIKDLRQLAGKKGPVSINELRKMRQEFDILAEKFRKSLDPTMAAQSAQRVRTMLRDELNDAITAFDAKLGERVKLANKDYFIAEKLEKALDKKATKDKDMLGLKDLVLGGAATGAFGLEGLLLPGASKFLESDLKRRMVILSGIEKSNKAIASKIKSASTNFFNAANKVAKPISIGLLARSSLARSEENKEPKNKKEAFANISKNIIEYVNNPELYETKIVKSVYPVSLAAPKTAEVLKDKSAQIVNFLYEKMPKDISDNLLSKPFARPYEPSTMELAKFERYLQVVEAPTTVIDELENGTLTREHVEALRTIYPRLYDRIRTDIMEQVVSKESLPYKKKIQLGILFDMPTDASMVAENLLALQSNFSPQPEPTSGVQGAVNSTAGGVSKLDMASREGTELERVQRRT